MPKYTDYDNNLTVEIMQFSSFYSQTSKDRIVELQKLIVAETEV